MARSDGDFCFLLHPSGILARALGKCSSEPKACDSQAAHSDVAFDPSIDTGGVMLLASITPVPVRSPCGSMPVRSTEISA